MIQHKSHFRLATAILLSLATSNVLATSTGISTHDGYSNPAVAANTCAASGCHSGGSFTGSAAWTGTTSLAPSGFADYTYKVNSSNASRNGISLSTRNTGGTRSGTFSNVSSGMQITTSNTHITHTTPGAAGKSWGFRWTAPSTVGIYTMFGCINQVDFTGNGVLGDGPPVCDTRPITVNTSPVADNETLGVIEDSGANTFLASTLLTGDTSGSSGNETGDSISIDTAFTLTTTGFGSAVYSGSNIVYTPALNDDSSDSLTYRIKDSLGATATATITIPITAVNDAPGIASTAGTSATEDIQYSYSVTASDVDDTGGFGVGANQLQISLSNEPAGMVVSSTTGVITWTPANGVTTSGAVTVTVADGGENSAAAATEIFTVSVTAVNDPPSITSTAGTAATEDIQYSYSVTASDVDDTGGFGAGANQLQISLSNQPAGMVVNTNTGVITWTPANGVTTSGIVTVTVADGGENSAVAATEMFTVSVTAVNDSPTITSTAPTSAVEDVQYSYTVVEGDPDDDGYGAGGELTISLSNEPTGMVVDANTGIITWTPANAVTTSGAVTVTVTDGGEDGSVAAMEIFTITVSGTNDPPFITSTAGTTATEDIQYSYQVAATDVDDDVGNPLEVFWNLTNEPTGMTISSTGLITWTPLEGVTTSGVVTVDVEDGNEDMSARDTENFTVTVTQVNDAPVITSTAGTTATEDIQYSYTVVSSDDDDTGGYGAGANQLQISLSNQPAGMVVNANTGIITWIPANGVTTSGVVTVTVADGGENSAAAATEIFTVSVTAVNDPPSITSTAGTAATEDIQYSYSVTASDVDDTGGFGAGANQLQISLSGAPAGMSVNTSTGLVTWTPTEGVLTSGTVTVTVADGGEDSAVAATENFTVTVTPVNDSPTITSTAGTAAIEDVAYSYQVAEGDPDDVGFGAGNDLTIALSNEPAGMVLDVDTGLVTWTPPRTETFSNAFSNITITVSDGGENGSVAAVETFTLVVNPPDGDSDIVADYSDNCPMIANGSQADNDADTVYVANAGFPVIGDVDSSDPTTGGDVCDTDDDNDGMPDVYENGFAFLDPFDAADASLDEDGDGVSNLDEFLAGTDPVIDTVGPTVTAPADVTVDATGFLTSVDTGVATASDGNDGTINTVIPVVDGTITCAQLGSTPDTIDPLRPGSYTITWHSCDSESNLSTATQSVTVQPLITTPSGQLIGEGQVASVNVYLNGDAATYPVTVDYVLGGSTATIVDDHDAISGTITITDPDVDGNTPGRVGRLDINIVNDGLAELDETIVVSLQNPVNAALGTLTRQIVTITDNNVAPLVDIDVDQNGVGAGFTIEVGGTATDVTITANAFDANGDTLTYDWSATDNALVAIATVSGNMFDLSAASLNSLATGLYTVSVDVSDGSQTTTSSKLLVAQGPIAIAPVIQDQDGDGIDDSIDGYVADEDGDGIPNYLDNLFLAPNVINNQTGDLGNSFIIETDAGLDIRKGTTAIAAGVDGVLISQTQLETNGGQAGGVAVNAVDVDTNTSGLYDFEIHGLNSAISSANVVIPLPAAIQTNSVYKKYNVVDGWFTFVEDSNNVVRSAPGELGVCPAPGSNEYTAGLTVLHYCVQLTIEDGGPNDADKTRNFVIKDPGGVAVQEVTTTTSSDSDGRIGVAHPLLLLIMLLPFAYVYRMQIRKEFVRILSKKKRDRY